MDRCKEGALTAQREDCNPHLGGDLHFNVIETGGGRHNCGKRPTAAQDLPVQPMCQPHEQNRGLVQGLQQFGAR